MDRKNWKSSLLAFVLVFNLAVTGAMALYLTAAAQEIPVGAMCALAVEEGEETVPLSLMGANMRTAKKYTLYIGTNDKDTYTQLIPIEEARNMVNEICTKYVDNYTVSEARGGWVDETGTLTQDETLIYFFYDVTERQITAVMDEILETLNQNTILLEEEQTHSLYYGGGQELSRWCGDKKRK